MVLTAPGGGRRIGLVVDHPLRDLHGIALVAHLLVQRGHQVVLVPFYAQSFDIGELDLDLLVVNYVRPANLRLLREAQRRKIALAVLDTEGGLLPREGPTSAQGVARFIREQRIDEALSAYMFWGTNLRDVVVAETELPPSRALVTGCPRFDLAHAPWSATSGDAGFVLVNTNFPMVNSAHSGEGRFDKSSLRAFGFSESRIDEIVALNQAVMDDVLDAVERIAAELPDRRFVLRPHPFEREGPYRERFGASANVDIHREGSVLDMLTRCSCLLHVNCSTAIEALMCGVPPISLDFANRPEMLELAALPTRISHRAGSVAEAVAMIERAGELGRSAGQDEIEPFFGRSDGQAAQRVAEAIDAIAHEAPRPVPAPPFDAKQWLLRMAGRVFGSFAIERLRQRRRPGRREKFLHEADLEEALQRFARAEGLEAPGVKRETNALGLPMLSLSLVPSPRAASAAEPAIASAAAPPYRAASNANSSPS